MSYKRILFAAFSTLTIFLHGAVIAPENVSVNSGKNPSATEKFAAGELTKYLQKITGVSVPSAREIVPGKFNISVGKACGEDLTKDFNKGIAHVEHDAFVIEITPSGIRIAGNSDRGTLYGVYQLLEDLQCRWFFPGRLGECIVQSDKLSFNEGTRRFVPDFNQRSIDVGATDGMDFAEIIDWAAKNRLNFIPAARMAFVNRLLPPAQHNIWTLRGGQQEWQFHVHNLNQMVPNSLFDTHPEYFALYKGIRHKIGTAGRPGYGGGNICTTNPDVIKLCAEFIIKYFDTHPEGMLVPLWPGDGAILWCECPSCKKLGGINFMGGRRGSMTRRMIEFGNAVAKIVAKKYPDRLILVPAYANYIRPVNIKLEPNVMLQYCLHGDYAHSIEKCSYNSEELTRFKKWADIAPGQLGVWEYFLLGDHISAQKENPAMLPVLFRIKNTLPYLKSIGVNNYYTQCSTKYWKHNMAAYYLTAKYTWSVDRNFDELLRDFCERMFGAGGKYIYEYYTLIENSVEKSNWHPTVYSDLAVPSVNVFTPQLLAKAEVLLENATAEKLTSLEKERLNILWNTFRFIRQNVNTQSMLGFDAGSAWGIRRGTDEYVMNPTGRELSADDIRRMKINAEDGGGNKGDLERIIFRAHKRSMPVIGLSNQALKIAVIPELGGRIIRMIPAFSSHNFFNEPSESSASIGDNYFNYGGYEEYIGRGFAGEGWECAYRCEKKGDSLILKFENRDFRLERFISLPEKNRAVLKIVSRLTNISGENKKTALRAHPAIRWTGSAGGIPVTIRSADGKKKNSTVNLLHDQQLSCADGECLIGGGNAPLLHYRVQSRNGGAIYFCKTTDNVFNVEYLGAEKMLKNGEYIEIIQTFTLTGKNQK